MNVNITITSLPHLSCFDPMVNNLGISCTNGYPQIPSNHILRHTYHEISKQRQTDLPPNGSTVNIFARILFKRYTISVSMCVYLRPHHWITLIQKYDGEKCTYARWRLESLFQKKKMKTQWCVLNAIKKWDNVFYYFFGCVTFRC